MGFRTVVMLNNDQAGEWEKDPELGRKIAFAMNSPRATANNSFDSDVGGYGRVVECTHSDTNTLAVLTGYRQMTPISHSSWHKNTPDDDVVLALLKDAAEKLGYELTKAK